MIEIDVSNSCTLDYCLERITASSKILARDRNSWGMPCICTVVPIDYYRDKVLDAKTRNMVRKAVKSGAKVGIVNRDLFLDEIFEINTSMDYRQGRRMDPQYCSYPGPWNYIEVCDKHFCRFVGVFFKDKLVGYTSLTVDNELTWINAILGHRDFLKYGIMNLSLYWIMSYLESQTKVKYIVYDFWKSGSDGLRHFKKSMGYIPLEAKVKERV